MNEEDPHKQMAAALGRIVSGLFVVTVRHGDQSTGMLASWLQQCSFEPPQLSCAVRRDRDILLWLTEGVALTVNILEADQTELIAHFGRGYRLDEDAFHGLDVVRSEQGAPILSEALAYLDCRVVSRFSAGDHDLLIARIVAGKLMGSGQPMTHVRKSGLHY